MDIKALHQQMAKYNAWKQQLDQRLQAFSHWCQEHRLITREAQNYLQRARKLLDGEHFTVACVGEFSRGKTELINALLYSDASGRLLPSQAGRTTMCPTEIFWDPEQPENCVRLLPIATRRSGASLQSFKRIPNNWFTIHFDPSNPESISQAIGQVSAHKEVTRAEASKLGFDPNALDHNSQTDMVQVPTWRHALINFAHPLLREGLRIVDTPGLNALGNEPELTLKTLPEAQAILFLLAADSGVSASDMTIWRDHIAGLREDNGTAVLALLNKIDTLWDELNSEADIALNIENVRLQAAHHLQMAVEHVLPLSAKQALISKIRHRDSDLRNSNFPQLEQRLAECILRSQQQMIGHRLVSNSHDMIINTHNSLSRRISESESELASLQHNSDANSDREIEQQREKIRTAHHRFHKQLLSLRTSQRMLNNQRDSLLAPVRAEKLQQLIAETDERMSQSWTTVGLARAIGEFFDNVDTSINQFLRETERANNVMASIYERPEHGQHSSGDKHALNITAQRRQLRNLERNAERFRRSLNSVLTSKHTLINRFLATLVREVQQCFEQINKTVEYWLTEALTPLIQHNQHQKQLLEHHMMRLGELRSRSGSHAERLSTLERDLDKLRRALSELTPLYKEATHRDSASAGPSAEVVSLQSARQALGG